MGWNEPDLYYQPEHFGVKVLGDVEWDYESYQFNMTVVWVDALGQFYVGDDSGCSCPSPFETFTTIDKLGEPVSKHQIARDLLTDAERVQNSRWMSDENKALVMQNVAGLIEKIMTYKGDNG